MALGVEIKPASYIECYFQPSYHWGFDDAQWVRNIDVDGDGIVEHFVYGTLNSKTLDMTTRLNVIFSRDLSIELYLQPFLAVGTYKHFKELARPSSYMFTPYAGLDYNPIFATVHCRVTWYCVGNTVREVPCSWCGLKRTVRSLQILPSSR